MGKSIKFTFPLSGRKNGLSRNDMPPTPSQFSKAQRILGTESINLTNSTSNTYQHCEDSCRRTGTQSSRSSLNDFPIAHNEFCSEKLHFNKKASSILGISQEQVESDKLSVTFNTKRAQMRARLWPKAIDQCPRPSTSNFKEEPLVERRDEKGSGMKNGNSSFTRSLADGTSYINQSIEHIAELPAFELDSTPLIVAELEDTLPQLLQVTMPFEQNTSGRPGSSASCPPGWNTVQSLSSAEQRNANSRTFVSWSKSVHVPYNRTLRPKNETSSSDYLRDVKPRLSSSSRPAKICKVKPREDTFTSVISPPPKEFVIKRKEEEQNDDDDDYDSHEIEPQKYQTDQVASSSTIELVPTNGSDWKPISPVLPYLTIPEFIDTTLSGPWSEGDNDEKCDDQPLPQYSDLPEAVIPDYPPQISELSCISSSMTTDAPRFDSSDFKYPSWFNESTQRISGSTAVAETESIAEDKQTYDYPFKTDNDIEGTNLATDNYYHSSSNSNIRTGRYDSQSSFCSASTLVDGFKSFDESGTFILDPHNDSDQVSSQFGSLPPDSGQILSTAPRLQINFGHDPDDFSLDSKRCSSIYGASVLMEVARVGLVAQKASIKDMTRRRRKEETYGNDEQKSHETCNHNILRDGLMMSSDCDNWTY